MGTLPCLWEQNEVADTGRYGTEKLSPLLSEVQAVFRRNFSASRCECYKYENNHRMIEVKV